MYILCEACVYTYVRVRVDMCARSCVIRAQLQRNRAKRDKKI